MYQFTRVDEDGELALYKNDNALSLGFMVKDSIRDWDIEAGEPLLVQNSFVEAGDRSGSDLCAGPLH